MWRNTVMLDFVVWLRQYNDGRPQDRQISLHGLDEFNTYAVLHQSHNKAGSGPAECGPAGLSRSDAWPSDHDLLANAGEGCAISERKVSTLRAAQHAESSQRCAARRLDPSANACIAIPQKACDEPLNELVQQYRAALLVSPQRSWNTRELAMMHSLEGLYRRIFSERPQLGKIVVWAHCTHAGKARATELAQRNRINLGQLLRERYPSTSVLLGSLVSAGSITASAGWGGPAQRYRLAYSLGTSIETPLQQIGLAEFCLPMSDALKAALCETRPTRTIGPVYLQGHDAEAMTSCLGQQFDALVYLSQARPLEPLDPTLQWLRG